MARIAKYGNAWESYPIKKGEVWTGRKEGSNARILCADTIKVLKSERYNEFIQEDIDYLYTDPPWSPANMKMFYTYSGRGYPSFGYADFMEYLSKMFYVINPRELMFVEMGVNYHQMVIRLLKNTDARTITYNTVYYGNPSRPAVLWIGTFNNKGYDIKIPDNMHGKQIIEWVNSFVTDGSSFIDPCCGKGTFFYPSIDKGKDVRYYGIELMERKVAHFIKYLDNTGYDISPECNIYE